MKEKGIHDSGDTFTTTLTEQFSGGSSFEFLMIPHRFYVGGGSISL